MSMRFTRACALVMLAWMVQTGRAEQQQSPFVGRWNLTGPGTNDETNVYWLDLKEQRGQLSGMFLNRVSSPVPLVSATVEGGELVIKLAGADNRPGLEGRFRLQGGKLIGAIVDRGNTTRVTGHRPPEWPAADANATHAAGTPVELFDGKSLDNWVVQHKGSPAKWSIADGAMTNDPPANNLVSKQTFKDFRIHAEYKYEKESNSGIYLRGRYELQVVEDYGNPPDLHSHMAIYGRTAPSVNASKPAGEWQVMDATIVGNKVTVTLNGKRVHDNATIEGLTGGTLDANETEPGPIMLQGDHGKIWYRNVTVTPLKD
jgi:3-keto-disaccharide hydrolase